MKRATKIELAIALLLWFAMGIWVGRMFGERMATRIGLEAVLTARRS